MSSSSANITKPEFCWHSYLEKENISITYMNIHIVIKFYFYKHQYVHQHIY